MSVIINKQGILSDDYEKINNVQLEEEIYQQMNLFKLEELNVVPLEEIRKKLDKKFGKKLLEEENNEVGEGLNIDEIESNLVNNIVPKPEEWGESSRRNTQFSRPRYVLIGRISNFSSGFTPRKTTSCEDISLTQSAKLVIS